MRPIGMQAYRTCVVRWGIFVWLFSSRYPTWKGFASQPNPLYVRSGRMPRDTEGCRAYAVRKAYTGIDCSAFLGIPTGSNAYPKQGQIVTK